AGCTPRWRWSRRGAHVLRVEQHARGRAPRGGVSPCAAPLARLACAVRSSIRPPGGGWRVRAERGVRAGVRPCPYPTPMPPAGGDREGEGGGATRVPPGTSPPPARG